MIKHRMILGFYTEGALGFLLRIVALAIVIAILTKPLSVSGFIHTQKRA